MSHVLIVHSIGRRGLDIVLMADNAAVISCAGTNLKVGGGYRSSGKRRKKFFRVMPVHFFSESTISRFGKLFRDGQ